MKENKHRKYIPVYCQHLANKDFVDDEASDQLQTCLSIWSISERESARL